PRGAPGGLVDRLERNGHTARALTGDLDQRQRLRTLASFKEGTLPILVATDVAARGLHIPDVSHVYNYDLPQDAEDYVHRIGRTARLGAEGDAISFACDMYAQSLPDIESYIGQKIPVGAIDPGLLVLPPPRHRPEPATPVVEEDDGSIETRPPPRQRRSRSHERRPERGPRQGRQQQPRERRADAARAGAGAATVEAASAPSRAESTAAAPGESPRRRSRRGGRGRRGNGANPRAQEAAAGKPA